MATLKLTITADNQLAIGSVKEIQTALNAIEQKPVTIKVLASGLDAIATKLQTISQESTKAAEAAAKLANAEARKINAETRAAQSAAKLAGAQRQQAQAAQETAQASQQAAISNEELAHSILQVARQQELARAQASQLFTAYREMAQGAQAATTQVMALTVAYRELGVAIQSVSRGSTSGYFQPMSPALNDAYGFDPYQAYSALWRMYGSGRLLGAGGGWTFDNGGPGGYSQESYSGRQGPLMLPGTIDAAADAAQNANRAFTAMGDGMSAAWKKMGEGSKLTKLMGASLDELVVKMTAWMVMGNIVATVVRTFREAFETMREVDTELTNIQKVTDRTNEEMKVLAERAYDVASAYGVAAQDYLSSVSAFAKAGFGDQSEALAELATKTQLVGDVTADVANKLILSANAAWKYNGDIVALTGVLDAANSVENNFSTSISKIAEGFPIVASTAAQAGLSVEQTIAMLGTITSVTQETGTKAATALRALILNIEGAVGEYEDGITVTEESVKSLTDLLNIYAADAMKAAEAQGKMIDPMEAIAALAKASETGLLNEKELFEMLSGLGGKLRTNQLTALVTNFDMINEQLAIMGESAGSADKEIDVMLSSWESKVNILKNTVTQFISHLTSTDGIKGGIDVLTVLVKALDGAAGKIIALTVVIYAGVKAIRAITTAIRAMNASLLESPLFWAAAIAAAIYGVIALVDKLVVTTKESADAMRDAQSAYNDAMSQVESLNGKLAKNIELMRQANAEGKDDSYRARLAAENALLREQLEAQLALAQVKQQEAIDNAIKVVNGTKTVYNSFVTSTGVVAQGGVASEETIQQLIDAVTVLQEAEDRAKKLGVALDEDVAEALASATEKLKQYTDATVGSTKAVNDMIHHADVLSAADAALVEASKKGVEAYDQLAEKLNVLTTAYKEITEEGQLTESTFKALNEQFPELQANMSGTTNDGKNLETELENLILATSGFSGELIKNKGNLYQEEDAAARATIQLHLYTLQAALASKQRINTSQSIAALSGLETQSIYTAAALQALINTFAYVGALDSAIASASAAASNAVGAKAYIAASMLDRMEAKRSGLDVNNYFSQQMAQQLAKMPPSRGNHAGGSSNTGGVDIDPGGNTGTGGSRSGGSGSSSDPILEAHKSVVSLLEAELALMKERGDSEDDIIAQQRLIQQALHDEAEYLRTIEGESENVVKLSTDWWKIENDINKTLEEREEKLLKEQEERYKSMKEEALGLIDAAEEAATGPLQRQLDILKERQNTIKEEREEQEKILAVEKARIALENAQRERTVRQYNARTGQWEWVANAKNVESARNALDEAQKNLSDFYMDRAVSALEKNIETIKESYQAMRDSVEEFAKRVESGAESIENAIEYLAKVIGGFTGADDVGSDDGGSTLVATPTGEHLGDKFGITTPSKSTATKTGTTLGEHTFGIDFRGGSGGITGSSIVDSVIASIASGGIGAASSGSLARAGIVTSGVDTFVSHSTGVSRSTIGSQHIGDNYSVNGLSISDSKARSTTLYELAQTAKNLSLQKGA